MKEIYINRLKEERAAASALVLFTVLMFVLILMGTYIGITTVQKAQLKSDLRIQAIYKEEVNQADTIYNELVNNI